jgi:hypothetical protein
VFTVTAVDDDLEGQIVYGLEGQFPVQSFFTVDSSTGVVTLRNSLLSDTTQNTIYTVRKLLVPFYFAFSLMIAGSHNRLKKWWPCDHAGLVIMVSI